MKKKRILIYILSVIAALFLLLAGILYIKRDAIKTALINGANQKLKVPFTISSVDISLRKFPSAALHFSDIYSPGSYSQPTDTLIFAKDLYLQFSIWQVITGNYSIHSISVENGVINIKRLVSGKHNYLIFKEDTTSEASVFTLNSVTGTNLKLSYFDDIYNVNTNGFASDIAFSGSFEPELIKLEVNSEVYVNDLIYDQNKYLSSIPLNLSFKYLADEGHFTLKEGHALVNNGLKVDFDIINENGITQISANTNNTDLGDFKDLAATQGWYKANSFNADGLAQANLSATIRDGLEDLTVKFITTNASLKGTNGTKLTDVNLRGIYQLSSKSDFLKLENISAKGKTGTLEGALSITDFNRPFISASLTAQLGLDEWLLFLPSDTIQNPKGDILVNVTFENRFTSFDKLSPADFKYAKVKGNVEVVNSSFAFKNSQTPIKNINGAFHFENNNLNIERLFVKVGESDLYLDGYFGNVVNVLLFKEEKLEVRSKVKSQQIILEDFLTEDESSDGDYTLNNLRGHSLDLNIEIDKFRFKKVTATNIKGGLSLNHGLLKARNTSFNMTDGSVRGDLTIDIATDDFYYISADASSQNLNIKELFYSFENFNQEEITGSNLEGKADIDIQLTARMSPTLFVDASSVKANTHVILRDGALTNYAPMLSLSRFADIEALKNIKFKQLENTFTIANSTLTVPNMEIRSSVLNLWLSGTHTFENNIDYSLKLKLDDVLFTRKKKSSKNEFDDYITEQQTLEDPYIYVKMTGPAADPTIGLDKKAISKSIKQEFKEEGEEFKDLFKKEDPKKKDNKPKIIFEWPEDSTANQY